MAIRGIKQQLETIIPIIKKKLLKKKLKIIAYLLSDIRMKSLKLKIMTYKNDSQQFQHIKHFTTL